MVNSGSAASDACSIDDDVGCADDDCQLRLIGFGAAVRLQSRPSAAYQLKSALEFHAPELLSSPVLQSNMRSTQDADACEHTRVRTCMHTRMHPREEKDTHLATLITCMRTHACKQVCSFKTRGASAC